MRTLTLTSLALLVISGCYKSNIVTGDTDAGVPDAIHIDVAVDVAIDTPRDTPGIIDAGPVSIGARFASLVGAPYSGETWLVARVQDTETLEPLPLHLYRPDYSGTVVAIGEPELIPDTTGWEVIAAARIDDDVAMVIEYEQERGEVLVYSAASQSVLVRAPIEAEGRGVLTARIAMSEDAIYVTSSWGLADEQALFVYDLEDGVVVPRPPFVLGTRLGAVPIAVVDGTPSLLTRERGVVRVWVYVEESLLNLRPLGPFHLPAWAGDQPLALDLGERQIFLGDLVVGTFPEASQINGYPSARTDDQEFVVALGLGGFGGVSWAYRPTVYSVLEWHEGPADGLAGRHVAHLGQGHAGVFYLDFRLGSRLPLLRYDGMRTE